MPKVDLPYAINDADNHFNEPLDLYERFIDPAKRDFAIRYVTDADGRELQLFAGRPSKFDSSQVTYSADELAKMLGDVPTREDDEPKSAGSPLPGMLLNRLNPLKGLSDDERQQLMAEFREQREAYGNRDVRLARVPGARAQVRDEQAQRGAAARLGSFRRERDRVADERRIAGAHVCVTRRGIGGAEVAGIAARRRAVGNARE